MTVKRNGVAFVAAASGRRPLLQDDAMPDIAIGGNDVLLVIDVQNDFCPGGALAVPNGDQVVPVINRLARRFTNVVLTQDWHPPGHSSFASVHTGRRPFDSMEADYGPQTLWPDHCVQGTPGADFHPSLSIPHAALVLRKGMRSAIDSYSAFYENDRKTPTGLVGYLRERGLTRVLVVGLAFDFCVRYSAEDAASSGFTVVVIEDACRGIDIAESMAAARRSFQLQSISCVRERDLSPEERSTTAAE
jgi:nicotinamidase/pyrazinamidase